MSARRIIGLCLVLAATLFAAGFLVEPLPARAAEAQAATEIAPPEAADILFERHQLAGTKPGDTLSYAYSRKVTDAELGPSFDDRIRLMIEPGPGGDARDVRVDFFSVERHHAAGPFEGVTTNPVLMLFLENHLVDLSGRLKGNPRYLKNAIRSALRDRARVETADISVDGRTLKGWRITVKPFEGDANATRMRGLESLTYTFDVAPDLPGEVARIEIAAEAPGGRLWEETIAYDPKGS